MKSNWTILFAIVLVACGSDEPQMPDPAMIKQELIDANRKQHQEEKQFIRELIKEKGWPMTETGSGLNYWIYEKGNGMATKMEQQVILTYTISLPDGTECYRNTDTPGSFVIGRDQVESGLHEVLLLMHLGDRAKVILPSHLAFGLTGDSGKIPSHATLIYDLHLVGIAE